MKRGSHVGSGSAVHLVVDAPDATAAIAVYRAVASISKDEKAKQIELLGKAVLA
jgi:hypothetical protein